MFNVANLSKRWQRVSRFRLYRHRSLPVNNYAFFNAADVHRLCPALRLVSGNIELDGVPLVQALASEVRVMDLDWMIDSEFEKPGLRLNIFLLAPFFGKL